MNKVKEIKSKVNLPLELDADGCDLPLLLGTEIFKPPTSSRNNNKLKYYEDGTELNSKKPLILLNQHLAANLSFTAKKYSPHN
jgi:hypothetical protein